MTESNNYLHPKGTLLVAPGGGGAFSPLDPPADGQALKGSPTSDLGMEWVNTLPGEGDVVGPASATNGNLVAYDGTTGKLVKDSGVATSDVALGAASSVANNFVSFSGVDGKQLADSGFTDTDFSPALVSGGAADTKGTFTLTLGASGDIATTAIAADSVVVVTVDTLGTVTAPQAMLVTKTAGVKFTITSADGTDTSSGTWAIL